MESFLGYPHYLRTLPFALVPKYATEECYCSQLMIFLLLVAVGRQAQDMAPGLHIRSHTETAAPPETTDRTSCPTVKPEVDTATFESLDIRVGLIVSVRNLFEFLLHDFALQNCC